ncbi:MAG: hypothetical protein RIS70_1340 [Planctomycetota bacterium]|jgi:putative membrane protein
MKHATSGYVNYNSKNWIQTAFAWHGTAMPICYLRILVATVYCAVCQLLFSMETGIWNPALGSMGIDAFGHTVLGSLIGFLLVVRMNGSNSRYWEGRSHWGVIVNSSRNLARAAATYTKEGKEIAGLIASYVISLRHSLRGSRDLSETGPFLPDELRQVAETFGNQPTAIAAGMTHWVARQARNGILDPEMTRHCEWLIAEMVSAQGGCEKIQKTPLPFAYVSLIKLMILAYLATLPLVLCAKLGWFSPLVMAVVALGMFGMEETSVEIEDPFGFQPNCIDLEVITITITRDAGQLAGFADSLQEVQSHS